MGKSVSHFHKDDPGKKITALEEMGDTINPYHPEVNTSEGGEFLDDAIRMTEQPLEDPQAAQILRSNENMHSNNKCIQPG